jgi:hypothetical protein
MLCDPVENHLLPLFVHFICFPLVQIKGRQGKETEVRVAWKLIYRYTNLLLLIAKLFVLQWTTVKTRNI